MTNRSNLPGFLIAIAITATLVCGCSTLPPFVPVPSNWTGGSEHADLIDNIPTVILDGPGTWQYRITLQKYQNELAFGYPVAMSNYDFVWSNTVAAMKHCWGTLYVSRDSVSFSPSTDNQCSEKAFTYHLTNPPIDFEMETDPDEPNMFFTDSPYRYAGRFAPIYLRTGTGHYELSDKDITGGQFASWLSLVFKDFDSAVGRFYSLTGNLALPLSAQQQVTLQANESSGDEASARHDYRQALSDYLAAVQVLPIRYAPRDIDVRLRTNIINLVLQLNPPPTIPGDAVRYEQFGKNAAESAHLYDAVDNFLQAVHSAPWWADGYYNLAVALEKAKMYGAAANALQWYLRAAPHASDAASVKLKIYNLQYQQSRQQSGS